MDTKINHFFIRFDEEVIGIFTYKYFHVVLLDSPAVFCFFRGGWLEGVPCSPDGTSTWAVGTEMMVGVPCVAIATVTVAFFMTFLGPSEEAGRAPSSYSFLFTVLFIWPLEGRWELNWLYFILFRLGFFVHLSRFWLTESFSLCAKLVCTHSQTYLCWVAISNLQANFQALKQALSDLNLAVNAKKTKFNMYCLGWLTNWWAPPPITWFLWPI